MAPRVFGPRAAEAGASTASLATVPSVSDEDGPAAGFLDRESTGRQTSAAGAWAGPDSAGLACASDGSVFYANYVSESRSSVLFRKSSRGMRRQVGLVAGGVVQLQSLRSGRYVAALSDVGELSLHDVAASARLWAAEGVAAFAFAPQDQGFVALLRVRGAGGAVEALAGGKRVRALEYVFELLQLKSGEFGMGSARLASTPVCSCWAGGAGLSGLLQRERAAVAFLSRDERAAMSAAAGILLITPGLGIRMWTVFPLPLTGSGCLPPAVTSLLPGIAQAAVSLRQVWSRDEWLQCLRGQLQSRKALVVGTNGEIGFSPEGGDLEGAEEVEAGQNGIAARKESRGASCRWLDEDFQARVLGGSVLVRAWPGGASADENGLFSSFVGRSSIGASFGSSGVSGGRSSEDAGDAGEAARPNARVALDGELHIQLLSANPSSPGGVLLRLRLRNSGALAVGFLLGLCDASGDELPSTATHNRVRLPRLLCRADRIVVDPGMASLCDLGRAHGPGSSSVEVGSTQYLSISPAGRKNLSLSSYFLTEIDYDGKLRRRTLLDSQLLSLSLLLSADWSFAAAAANPSEVYAALGAAEIEPGVVLVGVRDTTTGRCHFLRAVHGDGTRPAAPALSWGEARSRLPATAPEGAIPLKGFEEGLEILSSPIESLLGELDSSFDRAKAEYSAEGKAGFSFELLGNKVKDCVRRALATRSGAYALRGGSFSPSFELEHAVVRKYLDVLQEEEKLRADAAVTLRRSADLSDRARAILLNYGGATPELLQELEGRLDGARKKAGAVAAGLAGGAGGADGAVAMEAAQPTEPTEATEASRLRRLEAAEELERPGGLGGPEGAGWAGWANEIGIPGPRDQPAVGEAPGTNPQRRLLLDLSSLKRELARREAEILSLAASVFSSPSQRFSLNAGSVSRWDAPAENTAEFLRAHPMADAARGRTVAAARVTLGEREYGLDDLLRPESEKLVASEVEDVDAPGRPGEGGRA